MNLSDFIYLYSSRYHRNNVKCVLAIENWNDSDCDVKYARYIQDYIKSRNVLVEKDKDAVEIVLDQYSIKRSDEAYSYIFKNLISGLRNNCIISDEEYDGIKTKLDPLKTENFNFAFLKKAREIEESFYQNKFEDKK